MKLQLKVKTVRCHTYHINVLYYSYLSKLIDMVMWLIRKKIYDRSQNHQKLKMPNLSPGFTNFDEPVSLTNYSDIGCTKYQVHKILLRLIIHSLLRPLLWVVSFSFPPLSSSYCFEPGQSLRSSTHVRLGLPLPRFSSPIVLLLFSVEYHNGQRPYA